MKRKLNKNTKRKLIIVAVALQVLVLLGMAAKREHIRIFGQTIYLRSAPIDPRDPFRGDFVRLNYMLSVVGERKMHDIPPEYLEDKDRIVYAVLKEDGSGLYSLDYLTSQRPDQGIFIKGRTDNYRYSQSDQLRVKYGIEQYFVQQGRGLEMEKRLGTRDGLQTPMEMHVALGSDGTAVITGHRWSKLAVRLEVLREGRARQDATTLVSPQVRVTLKNVSDSPLALVNPDDHCAFHLVEAGNRGHFAPSYNGCSEVSPEADDVVILAADEAYVVELDLGKPRWHMRELGGEGKSEAREIGAFPRNSRFRLEYRSPSAAEFAQLGVEQEWVGTMPTPAFNSRGRVD